MSETRNTDNGRLRALDGSYYVIAFPHNERKRPAHLGPVNFEPLCSECREVISDRRANSKTCCKDCGYKRGLRLKREKNGNFESK